MSIDVSVICQFSPDIHVRGSTIEQIAEFRIVAIARPFLKISRSINSK